MPPTAPEHHARHVIFACRALPRRVDPARPPWSARAVRAGSRSASPPVVYNELGTYRSDPPRFEVWYHPNAGVLAPERALTGDLPYVASLTQNVTWARATTGAVALSAGHKPSSDNNRCPWTPNHNWGLQPQRVGQFQGPFMADNSRHQVVFLDEAVLASAIAQAEVWDVARRSTSGLREQARALVAGIEDAWSDRAVVAAKERFLEDYADESLWEDHSKTLKIQVPFAWRGPSEPKGYTGTRAALAHLVDRLVEDGMPPYGLTVAEAIDTLAEELVTHAGHDWRGDHGGKVVTIAPDVLELRFPDAPPVVGLLESA